MPAAKDDDFAAVQAALAEEFIRSAPAWETDEELAEAFLDFILQRERLRRGVPNLGPERDVVDGQTLDQLANGIALGPEHQFAEAFFKRLAKDAGESVRYYRAHIEALSAKQSVRGKRERPRGRSELGKALRDIAEEHPNLSAAQVGRKLEEEGYRFESGQLMYPDGGKAINVADLKKRWSEVRQEIIRRGQSG
jgi:hypothetical protein